MKPTTMITVILLLVSVPLSAAEDGGGDHVFNGLNLRAIGPAITSGRISDFAFHPDRKHEYYVATASGNLWKTENNGITWSPLFENEASFAIGVVTLDPNDPLVVWVGTGENNAQRSVAYGDGVYKSADGGKSWTNMGLKDSRQLLFPKISNPFLTEPGVESHAGQLCYRKEQDLIKPNAGRQDGRHLKGVP